MRISSPRARATASTPLLGVLTALLPESPFLYPDDEISTQTVRFFAGELVRETALEQLDDEVPYSVACEIEEFREAQSPVYIRAVLHVERESQKRILIGAGGQRVRDIGRERAPQDRNASSARRCISISGSRSFRTGDATRTH